MVCSRCGREGCAGREYLISFKGLKTTEEKISLFIKASTDEVRQHPSFSETLKKVSDLLRSYPITEIRTFACVKKP